jgi:putative flippase GtrA
MSGNIKNEVFTFTKAQGSALVATLCDYMMRVFLDLIIGLTYIHATFFGALTGGIVNCCINYRFVFSGNDARKRDVAWRYLIIWTGSILLNTGGTGLFKEVFGIKAYFSMLITSAIVAVCWNYMMQRLFVFRGKKDFNIKEDEL